MPWCPKCKNEYREGIRICADCGCELVETEKEAYAGELTGLIFGSKEQMEALKHFLEYNQILGTDLRYDEKEQVWELLVRKEEQKRAASIAQVFLTEEARRQASETDTAASEACGGYTDNTSDLEEQERDAETDDLAIDSGKESTATEKGVSYGLYQNSAERAEENRSSAWMLLIVGAAGLAVMVLGMCGLLPFHLTGASRYMVYGIMSALFILFIVMGMVSFKNSRIFESKAQAENSLRDSMEKWCLETLTREQIDAELGDTDGLTEEILYFKRYEKLKEKLNRQFVNLDQAFLDNFVDEIYDWVFTEDAEKLQ